MTPDFQLEPRSAARIRAEIARAGGNEVCFLTDIDGEGLVTAPRVVARGNQRAVLAATRVAAPGSLIVHNHPSGDPTPSHADIQMTKQITDIAKPLGIEVHDHIIVGREGHASLKGLRLI